MLGPAVAGEHGGPVRGPAVVPPGRGDARAARRSPCPRSSAHTAASLAIRENASVQMISGDAGHRSATQTLDRYGHLCPSDLDALAQRLDRAHGAAAAELWPRGGPLAERYQYRVVEVRESMVGGKMSAASLRSSSTITLRGLAAQGDHQRRREGSGWTWRDGGPPRHLRAPYRVGRSPPGWMAGSWSCGHPGRQLLRTRERRRYWPAHHPGFDHRSW
jgi:hypothetical protein